MNQADPRSAVLRRTAWICAFLVFSIVGISAWIRLSAAGLDCTPWPQCYGQVQAALPSAAIDILRVAHRVSAVLLLPLVLLLVMGGFARKPDLWAKRWTAVLALAVTLFLAVLGRWTAGSRLPAIALGNLLGGFVLFALCLRMALVDSPAWRRRQLPPAARRWRSLAFAVVLLQVALGGLVSSALAALSCPELARCGLPDPFSWQALNLWHAPVVDAARWPVHPEGAVVQLLHRSVALLATLAVAVCAALLLRGGWRRTGYLLLALLALQLGLGLTLVLAGLPLALAVAHNLVAALLLALLLALP